VSRVSHGTPAGDAYLDLKTLAQRTDRPTEELLQLYVLEGFLARLAESAVQEKADEVDGLSWNSAAREWQ
jgi:hypothetical protein